MYVTHLSCFQCQRTYEKQQVHQLCLDCGKPLQVHYDLAKVQQVLTPQQLAGRPANMWRYREVLPVEKDDNIVTLGEGFTPLLPAQRLGARLGMSRLFIKDEATNPTGSFKARGLAMAVSMAKELGLQRLAIPTAGNAGGALAAYAARAGQQAFIFMPQDTPQINRVESIVYGAQVTKVPGLITDCAKIVMERKATENWFDVSTLKEPYRVEGKKTMGYELAEQFNWQLPDVVLYPTGGGTGLIGMWKAFDEMQAMGWIDSRRPRMVSVQATGCAPIVRAYEAGLDYAAEFENAHTVASGLRVPRAIGDFIMLRAIRTSGGTAIAVTDEELMTASYEIAQQEGIFAAPEGGATLAALKKMLADGSVKPNETVVLFNTGSGMKYLEAFAC
jgi:threonine synthase